MQQSPERKEKKYSCWTCRVDYETPHPAFVLESDRRQGTNSEGKELWAFCCFLWAGKNGSTQEGWMVGMMALQQWRQPWLSHFVSASPFAIFHLGGHMKIRSDLISRIEPELCSSTGSQGMDVLLSKKQSVLLHGAEDSEAWGLALQVGPSTCGHLQWPPSSPPFGKAFRIKAQLRQPYHMDTCDFCFVSNWNNLSILWKKMALSKFSNGGEI